MSGEVDKKVSAQDTTDIHFSALIKELMSVGGTEALDMASRLSDMRDKTRSIVTGEPTPAEIQAMENNARRRGYIRKLAYAGGKYKNGLLKKVKLTEENLAEMRDLGMGYSYSNDDLINRTAFGAVSMGGNRVALEFPDGISGELYFRHSPEDGSLFYSIRKNCNRSEDKAAA
jgi:hypothetical protein